MICASATTADAKRQAVLSTNTALDCIVSFPLVWISVDGMVLAFSGQRYISLREAVRPGFTVHDRAESPFGDLTPWFTMATSVQSSTPALRVQTLRKAYDDVVAVDGLDLEVHAGECFGLLGPNGAGKTTTIEICEGLLAPDSGSVEVLGRTWNSHSKELRELLGIQ